MVALATLKLTQLSIPSVFAHSSARSISCNSKIAISSNACQLPATQDVVHCFMAAIVGQI